SLYCDGPVKFRILGFVNHSHPALTYFLQDAIVENGFPDHEHGPSASVFPMARLYTCKDDVQKLWALSCYTIEKEESGVRSLESGTRSQREDLCSVAYQF